MLNGTPEALIKETLYSKNILKLYAVNIYNSPAIYSEGKLREIPRTQVDPPFFNLLKIK
jgi:hypothetical protein